MTNIQVLVTVKSWKLMIPLEMGRHPSNGQSDLLGLNPSIETSQLWLWEWSHICSKFPTNQDMRIPDFPTFISQWTTPASQRRLSPRRHPTATVRKLSKFLKCIGLVRQISLDASFWRPGAFLGFWCWSQLEILKLEPSWLLSFDWRRKKDPHATIDASEIPRSTYLGCDRNTS